MTGLIGGTIPESALTDAFESTPQKTAVETVVRTRGEYTLGIRHFEDRDPDGWRVYEGDGLTGVVYGAIPGLRTGEWTETALFTRLLSAPEETLSAIDGPFALACTDGDRLVVATDKLGTRPVYYTREGGEIVFGSNLSDVAATVADPTVDDRAVADMLLLGHVWGEKTLLTEASFLGGGSVLRSAGTAVETNRYWQFEFDARPRPSFTRTVADAYRECLADTAATMDGESTAMWLSGGLDSRAMAGELSQHLPGMRTYTYDANPAGGGNLGIARDVSSALGLSNEQVDLSPASLTENFADAVSITDGMLSWKTFLNLTATFELEGGDDVLLEACGQGGMMGDGIGRAAIELSESPEDALYRAKHQTDREAVGDLLAADVDPVRSYREAVAESSQDGYAETVLEAYYRNYFPRADFLSNKLVRSQTGTRVPFAHGDFLRAVEKMPLRERVGWIPGTRGKIPAGTAAAKLDLVRELGHGLDRLRYERTNVAPEQPLWQHAVGFVAGTSLQRLRGNSTYGGRRMHSVWSITDEDLRELLMSRLDDAMDRAFLNADAVTRLITEHFETEEADRIGAVASVTTLEQWLQSNYD